MTPAHEELLREFRRTSVTAPAAKLLMEHISQRLHETMTRYNWVGFYLVDPADAGFLLVGPFSGKLYLATVAFLSTQACAEQLAQPARPSSYMT